MGTEHVVWDPAKYVEFGDFRDRPFFDLTGRIAASAPRAVVDLGCGPGTLTAALAARWPEADVLGLDSSQHMIAQANGMAQPANLSFELANIKRFVPDKRIEVIVSNAALQWVPGHQALMAGWLDRMAPGSWLAVQVPGNFDSPSHALMRQVADSPRWASKLAGVLRHEDAVWEPDAYLDLFLRGGCRADVWETTYNHLLTGEAPVLNWMRGTGLRPVVGALGPGDAAAFEAEYAALLAEAYPPGEFGTVFPFRRIFMVGQKK
ncbi:trans-aconitate 2-methyltransferase [Specibacter cremeus]|uniref:trans-aconitate 2-methyltransferase n=1 Tax=Specibacter cremeus TaxID=1629051 RepID=UPI000F76AC5E|nr:trans-aconitate 2-methyltransferase [Specibacter cremeus]